MKTWPGVLLQGSISSWAETRPLASLALAIGPDLSSGWCKALPLLSSLPASRRTSTILGITMFSVPNSLCYYFLCNLCSGSFFKGYILEYNFIISWFQILCIALSNAIFNFIIGINEKIECCLQFFFIEKFQECVFCMSVNLKFWPDNRIQFSPCLNHWGSDNFSIFFLSIESFFFKFLNFFGLVSVFQPIAEIINTCSKKIIWKLRF